jgi:hypothetical protein
MTVQEWRDDLIDECKIPLWKFLRITHYYTERVGIYVVSGQNWQRGDHDFWLSRDVFGDYLKKDGSAELSRLLKYYADVPVWNVCADWAIDMLHPGISGKPAVTWLTARCDYDDIRAGLAQEKADRRMEQRREYEKRRRAKKDGAAISD